MIGLAGQASWRRSACRPVVVPATAQKITFGNGCVVCGVACVVCLVLCDCYVFVVFVFCVCVLFVFVALLLSVRNRRKADANLKRRQAHDLRRAPSC